MPKKCNSRILKLHFCSVRTRVLLSNYGVITHLDGCCWRVRIQQETCYPHQIQFNFVAVAVQCECCEISRIKPSMLHRRVGSRVYQVIQLLCTSVCLRVLSCLLMSNCPWAMTHRGGTMYMYDMHGARWQHGQASNWLMSVHVQSPHDKIIQVYSC